MGVGYDSDENTVEECPLADGLRLVAKQELREDDVIRTHSLRAMRNWIRKHPDIVNCRTDAPFLLRFLRTKKFSIPMAQDMLERYLVIRQLYPQWFSKLDVDDPVISDILDSGYLVPLPGRDEFGRCVMFSCAGRFDPYKYTSADMARVHALIGESLMDDPENQIKGYSYVNDESGLLMGHMTLWSFSDLKRIIRCLQCRVEGTTGRRREKGRGSSANLVRPLSSSTSRPAAVQFGVTTSTTSSQLQIPN
ncbi:PREDICTED: clavesin-1-like [Diuraphis noxia]|uniref:clavesin-1-like n=1 Tax=Diuraphis noxia TaxID=143948 RepID=UPI0007636934|nr:PREDICTED: clavesin-1-like [Diuraphis noxia]